MLPRQLIMRIVGGILVLFSLVVEAYGVNLANNSSFECGLDTGYGYDGIVAKDDTTAFHGISSLRIDTPDLFEVMSDDIQLKPNTQYRFSVWAKASEGSDRTVVMRLSSSETSPWAHNIIIFTPTTEWAQYSSDYYTVVVDPLSKFILVPEKNKNFRIWFENKGGTTGTSVWLDAIEVEETTGDIGYTPPPFEIGIEKISKKYYTYLGVSYPVNFRVRNNTSSSKTLQINYRVLDEYFNKEAKADTLDITTEANSTTAMMLANISPDRRGKYIVYTDLLDGGTIISSSTFEFAVIEEIMKGESQFTDGFTVCGHSGGRALDAGTDEEVYDFRAEAGDRWIRDRDGIILKWSSIEPAEGEFVWTDFDKFLNETTKRGIRILPNLGSGCNYAQPDVPPNLPAWLANDARSQIVYYGTKKVYLFPIREWRDFVRACVTRYRGRITHWEILNEPGSYLTPAQYVSYLQAAFEEIKAADPAAKVIGICETQFGNTSTQFLKGCFENIPSALNYCDIISFHGYRARLDGTVFSEPQIPAEKGISDMKAVMNTYGAGNKELWMTELYYIGKPIIINGVNVDYPLQWDIKGHEPARRFLIDLANGISKSFCVRANYYTKHWAPKSRNDRAVGLVPSRWFVIYNTLAKLFESSTFVKQVLNTGFTTEYLKLYIYDKSGVPIAATWHYSDTGTFTSLEFPGATGKIKILDIMGNPASAGEVKQTGEKTVLPQVSNTPYYIIPDNGTTRDEFINLMSAAGIADDKSPPVCSIRINNDSQYTNVPSVTLNISATDNFGVAGYYISTDSTVPSAIDPGWISVTKTANYNANIFYTLSSGDGIKNVYVWCKDAAGNVSNTASDTIEVDSIVPVISISSPSSESAYTTKAGTISLGGVATDDRSAVTSVIWSSNRGGSGTANGTTSWTTSDISLTDGETVITVTAADGAGNTGTDAITVKKLDTTVPVGTIVIKGGDAYTNNALVTVGLSATDNMGITGYYLSSSDVVPSAVAEGWVTIMSATSHSATVSYTLSSGEGSKTVYVWYKDDAGNISGTAGDSIDVDTTAPVVTITSPTSDAAYTTKASTISLGGVADDRSGITNVIWSSNRGGSGTANGTTSWTTSDISLTDGETVITVIAADGAGNTGTDTITVKKLDTTAPVGTIVIKGGDAYTNNALVTVGLLATDNVGIAGYYFSLSDVVPSAAAEGWVTVASAPSYNATVSYTLSGGDGSKTVYVWYKDDAGNISGTASDSINVDTIAPVVTITSPTTELSYTATVNTINLSGGVTEEGSGIKSVTWNSDKGGSGVASGTMSWTISDITLTSSNTVITVTATDAAGNTGTDTITVSYSGAPAQTGLSALYSFEEGSGATAFDTSGNNNDGKINGATWTNGKSGSGLSFNGTNNYVTITNSLPAFSEFACSAWVQVADLAASRGVFTSGGSNTSGFRFRVNTDGSVWMMMAGGGSYNTLLTAAGVVKSGSFYHITVTGKSGQYMRIYVNGVLAKEKITTQTVTTPISSGYIGTSWNTTAELMKGIIDDVRIYKRTLSDQEVLDLYNRNNALSSLGVPAGSISINNGNAYTNSLAVLLNLSATDNVGVVGYYISSSDITPSAISAGWVSVTSAPSYNATVSYTLSSGEGSKTVYVWYKDSDGNISSAASDSIVLDTTAPVVTITTPSSAATYTATVGTVNVGGSVAEGGSGVSVVVWSSDKGGSGTASGTTSWTISDISLTVGDTIITVTSTDGAGNTGSDIITVSYAETTAPTGLSVLYTFNEGSGTIVHDTSGYGNNGTVKGATWTTGKMGSALSFNGTGSYVSISNSLPAFSEFTCCAWVKAADLAANRGIFTSGGSNTSGFRFRVNTDGSVWMMMAGGGTYNTVLTAAGVVKSGLFYHISVTGKSGQYMRIYVNGVLAKEKITTQTVATPIAPGYIGTSWSTTSELMKGIIDDVRIYKRALSNQEVIDVYNAR